MKMSEMFPSNYLKKEDITRPVTTTIRAVSQEEVQGDGGKELKAVLHFTGDLKQMILNRGNAELLCMLYGDDSDAWHGKRVEIFVDPSVMFAGKRVGGLRLRQPSMTGGNDNGNMQQHDAPPLWDLSDGKSVEKAITAEQVRQTIARSGQPASVFKVKPAGSPREMAKPADQYGFGVTTESAHEEQIPF